MAVKTSLGRVGLVLRGEYNPETPYVRLDVVYRNKGTYVCRKDCVGVPVSNAEYWQVVVNLDGLAADLNDSIHDAEQATEDANTAAERANNAADHANSVADAIRNISFDINADAELEVNIPWQS